VCGGLRVSPLPVINFDTSLPHSCFKIALPPSHQPTTPAVAAPLILPPFLRSYDVTRRETFEQLFQWAHPSILAFKTANP
jgi:hypothetical protein